jgi:hypothetical protein
MGERRRFRFIGALLLEVMILPAVPCGVVHGASTHSSLRLLFVGHGE